MYRVLDRDIAEFAQKLHNSGKYEKTPFIPTATNRRIAQAEANALMRRVRALDGNDPVLVLLAGHFVDFIEATQSNIDGLNDNPGRVLQYMGGRASALCHSDYRPANQRADVLLPRLAAAPEIWNDAVSPALGSLEASKLKQILFELNQASEAVGYAKPKLKEYFKGLPQTQIAEIATAMDTYQENLAAYMTQTGKIMEEKGGLPKASARGDDEVVPVTQEEYRNALRNNMGVDLDELLDWHEYENAKTRAESLALANKIKGPVKTTRDVGELLFKYAGPCDSPEEMFARVDVYLKRARAAAHDYIWLPEDELCECIPIPEQLKDSYPWGGYNSDWPSRYPLYNHMFLNNFNYKAITDGWIKINALHEAYPGHHAQFIRCAIDPIPETMKRGAKSVALTEGVCIRTERVFEFVFAEDPYYPLMVAHRRHHTSTRIKIDLMLHYFGKTIGEACDLYEQEMGFDRKTARAQVQAHENSMGYFTSYYYGMKKLCDWEKQYNWDKRDYTELLFSCGRVSLDTFESILKLNPEDRHSLQHDFASLLQFA
jgi:hypothetical protein